MKRCLNCMMEYPDDYGSTCPGCGYVEGATQNGSVYLQPGSILQGRYIVGTVIKARETDVFYIGWDALFDRKVQIQEYFPEYCATRSGKPELSVYDNKQEIFQEGLVLFYQQSRQLIRLYREEDIITYHACFYENGTAYAIMDYRLEKTLRDRLDGSTVRGAEAEELLDEAVAAVIKAHEIGVYHGMIDLDSFWVSAGGGLVLKDFGATRYVSGQPGIVDYGCAGPHTDVYGVAKMFCRMITGKEIEDGEKLESELARRQYGLKKPMAEALKRALLHQTRTMENFYRELWGRRKVPQSRKKKSGHNRLTIPKWLIIAAAVLVSGMCVFAGLVVTGVVKIQLHSSESQVERGKVRVPNLINEDIDKAEKLLRRADLQIIIEESVYSDIPREKVTYQEFSAGYLVDRGSEIKVHVSSGPPLLQMPSVLGMAREEAEKQLKEMGFTNVSVKDSTEAGIVGMISSQNIEKDAAIACDEKIELEVYAKAEETQSEQTNAVPDLTGMAQAEAEEMLKAASFKVETDEESSDDVKKGHVIHQNPEAGNMANEGSTVHIYISSGQAKVVLDNNLVQYKPQAEAETQIKESGLEVGAVTEEYSSSVPAGCVVSWDAQGQSSSKEGKEIEKGTKVDLVISRGAEPQKNETKPTAAPKETKAPAAKPTQAPGAPLPPQPTPAPTPEPTVAQPAAAPDDQGSSSGGSASGKGGSAGGSGNAAASPTAANHPESPAGGNGSAAGAGGNGTGSSVKNPAEAETNTPPTQAATTAPPETETTPPPETAPPTETAPTVPAPPENGQAAAAGV